MVSVLRLTILTALAGGAGAWADGPKDKPAVPQPHYTNAGEIEGVLVKASPADAGGGSVTLRVSKVVLDSGKGNYGRRGSRLNAKVVEQELEFTLTPDAQVRWHKMPKVLGADGKPRQRTPEELREQSGGPAGLPGYPAKPSDLAPDQVVVLHLVKLKDQERAPAPPPAPP